MSCNFVGCIFGSLNFSTSVLFHWIISLNFLLLLGGIHIIRASAACFYFLSWYPNLRKCHVNSFWAGGGGSILSIFSKIFIVSTLNISVFSDVHYCLFHWFLSFLVSFHTRRPFCPTYYMYIYMYPEIPIYKRSPEFSIISPEYESERFAPHTTSMISLVLYSSTGGWLRHLSLAD